MEQPKQVVHETLSKTKEIAIAVQQLQKLQEDADKKVRDEMKAHAGTKQKVKAIEADHMSTKQAHENEAKDHLVTKTRLEEMQRATAKTNEALAGARDDVGSMRLQMEAMKVEMEAQRKAFVVNVNWAARCTELKTKFDQASNEYDQLHEATIAIRADMEAALRAQEEFRMKQQAALDAYEATRAQFAKQAEELAAKSQISDDVAKKLAELEEYRAKAAALEVQKRQGNSQAMSVLQRSLAQGEQGLKTASFTGWATFVREDRERRKKKDKAMQRTMKTIANEGTALLATVYKEWAQEMQNAKRAAMMAAQKRLQDASGSAGAGNMTGRQRAIQQLEKQFAGEDKALTTSCFQGWANGQIARKKKEQNHKKASRMIANSSKGLLCEIVSLWNELTEKTRQKKKQKDGSMQRGLRMIANSDLALQAEMVTVWWGWIEDIRRQRKGKEAGTAKAMRMMANSDQALMNVCFDSWAKARLEGKKKGQGNQKALRMMANSSQALLITCWQGWAKARATRSAKDSGHAKAVRMINSSKEALLASVFQSWRDDFRKDKDRNKKIRTLEKSFGARDAGLKVVVLNSWQNIAKVEGRQKRAKEQSMKTAMKSVSGNIDLLLIHVLLSWARAASVSKVEKIQDCIKQKEEDLQAAVEQARVAVEEDLVKAQREVADVAAQLDNLRNQRSEMTGTLQGLQTRVENSEWAVKDRERQIQTITQELDQSRRKAKDIGEELAKVGIFIQSHAPRKTSRSGSDSRPRSGSQKGGVAELPPLDRNSRPRSGAKDGSKSARGVSGERSGSARRNGGESGRRPLHAPKDVEERRYLDDRAFTYGEFLEIFAERGQDFALTQWQVAMPEMLQDASYGDNLATAKALDYP